MKSVQFNFKGLMCPVFTPFTDDKKRTINYDVIDKYAQLLKQKNLHAICINDTIGEGTTLKLEERIRVTEEWFKACRKHQLVCMVQIGGTAVADVYELAAHAERLGVDAVLCLPELFYKPDCEEDLVHYLKEVAQYCPTRPLFYHHIPMFTRVRLSMPRFCDLADKEIPTFCGLKYTSGDLSEGVSCLKKDRTIFLGKNKVWAGALALGFDSAILRTLTLWPELNIEIQEHMRNGRLQDAMNAQIKLTKRIEEVSPRSVDWVDALKKEGNKVITSFKVGPVRAPIRNIIRKQY